MPGIDDHCKAAVPGGRSGCVGGFPVHAGGTGLIVAVFIRTGLGIRRSDHSLAFFAFVCVLFAGGYAEGIKREQKDKKKYV